MASERSFELRGDNLTAFEDETSREWILSGPAGTGKTISSLTKILHFGSQYPGARMLIVRKTRKSLTETALVTWERHILGRGHPILAHPIKTSNRHEYTFPNGSVLVTGGMDDPVKVLSSEWDLIYVNEATELSRDEWEHLGFRLRSMCGPYDQLFGDANPASPEHWLYRRCMSGGTHLYKTFHWDNPAYYDADAAKWTVPGRRYIANRLVPLTGHRRERFLLGNWTAAEGVVYDFSEKIHLKPSDWIPDSSWRRVWSIDWGKTSPTVLALAAVDEDGRAYFYREVYQTRLRPDQLGKWAAEQIQLGNEKVPLAVVCDHDPLPKELFEKASGLHLTLADKTDRDRGIQEMQSRFDLAEDGLPRIFFRQDCRETLRGKEPDRFLVDAGKPTSGLEEILGYTWSADYVDDQPQDYDDHAMDSYRYNIRHIDKYVGKLVPSGPRRPVKPLINESLFGRR